MQIKKFLSLVSLILLALNACATTSVSPFGKEGVIALEEDEKRLWISSEEEQKKLHNNAYFYEDSALILLIHSVTERLTPEDIKGKVSIQTKVIKNPHVNAFTFPNGRIYIHTGFLAKMENEAQLATVLAHEMTHFINRHRIQQVRRVRSTASFLGTLHVVAAPAGVYGLAPLLLGAIGAMAAVSGYSQELESEADSVGFNLLVRAGYDPAESVKLFERVQKHAEEEKIKEPFFFGSHPHLQERKDNYARLLQSEYGGKGGDKVTERFLQTIHPILLDNAAMDLSMGRFNSAKDAIDRFLQNEPGSAKGHYTLGEFHRKRGQESDTQTAEKLYLLAVQHDPSYADPHKGLGLTYLKWGQKDKAREALERYLSLAPHAEDKAYIEQYLQEIANR